MKIINQYILVLSDINDMEEFMKKCLYCKKEIDKDNVVNKVGDFCSEEHYEKYLSSLSREEYIELQHSFCVCSDD